MPKNDPVSQKSIYVDTKLTPTNQKIDCQRIKMYSERPKMSLISQKFNHQKLKLDSQRPKLNPPMYKNLLLQAQNQSQEE